MNRHTPGPWTVNRFGDVEAGAGFIVASVNGTPDGGVHANLRLIASAPDLLADLTARELERASIVQALRGVKGSHPLPSGMSLAGDIRTLALTIADLRESIRRMALDGYVDAPVPASRWSEVERRLLLRVVEHAIGYDLFFDDHEDLMRLRAEMTVL